MSIRRFLLVVCLLVSSAPLRAQSGHWEGVIHAAAMDVAVEVDLARNAKGELAGTFGNPSQHLRGLALADVAVNGAEITFAIKATSGGGVFRGTVSGDAQSMKGVFVTRHEGEEMELPFELARKGEAKFEPAPKSAAIARELEGQWSGTIAADGATREVGLSLSNQPDGTSTGVVISSQGMEIPIASIVQKGTSVTLDVRNIGGSFAGTLNGSALTGTWTQGTFVAPLAFHRAGPIDRWAKAAGGRQKIAGIRAIYREATIELGGYQGTMKVWHTADGKYRKEEQVAAFATVETFDGTSGVVKQGETAPRAMAGGELALARSRAFANANAVFFAFFPERRRGSVAIEPNDTIVMKPEGGVEWRITLDPQTSLPKTMSHQQNDRNVVVTFTSYETVDGITLEKEIHRTMGDKRFDAVIRFTKTVFNPPVDAALFASAAP